MNMTGTISIKDNFSEAIKKAQQTTDKFSKSIEDAKQNIDELKKQKKEIKVLLDAKKAKQDLIDMQKRLNKIIEEEEKANSKFAKLKSIGSAFARGTYGATVTIKDYATDKIKGIGKSLLSLGKMGLLAGTAATGAGVYHSINLAAQMEQTRISMGTLMKDQGAGDDLVNQLKTFAIQTPYEFNDLANNTRFGMAMGFKRDDLLSKDGKSGLLVDAGNASAGLGKGAEGLENIIRALGQMQAKGKVSAQEINQLAENGVGAWNYIAKSIGKTTAETMKLGEDGLLPAQKAIEAIRHGMQGDFGGMMIKQSRTLIGLWSSLKDFANLNVFASFGEGIRQGIIPYLSKMVDGLTKNQDAMKVWQDKLTDAGKAIGNFIGNAGERLWNWFQKLSSDENFRKMSFGQKMEFALNQMLNSVNAWMDGDGGKRLSAAFDTVGVMMVNAILSVLEKSGPKIGEVLVKVTGSAAKSLTISLGGGILEATDEITGAKPIPKMTQQQVIEHNKKADAYAQSLMNKKASGISYVPKDNYPALLHKGERVLTSVDNKNYNQGGSGIVVNMTNNVNASDPNDVNSLISKIEDVLYELAGNMPKIPQTS